VITMGSPLSLFSLVAQRTRPDRFKSWTNFFYKRDPISFPMAKLTQFQSVKDVELDESGSNLLALHGAYWTNERFTTTSRPRSSPITNRRWNSPTDSPVGPCAGAFSSTWWRVEMAGMSQAYADYRDVKFTDLIAPRVRSIFAISTVENGSSCTPKISRPHCSERTSTFELHHARDSMALNALSYHFENIPVEVLRTEIDAAIAELKKIVEHARQKTPRVGRLRVYVSRNMINHAFYRFDDLYLHAEAVSQLEERFNTDPCYSYRSVPEKGWGYEWLMRDFEELLKSSHDSECVFDSSKP